MGPGLAVRAAWWRWLAVALAAAVAAMAAGRGLICPAASGPEAALSGLGAGDADADRPAILAAPSLLALINHLRGQQVLPPPRAEMADDGVTYPDLAEIKGLESAKRVLEVAAAGGQGAGQGRARRLPRRWPPTTQHRTCRCPCRCRQR